MTTENPYSPHRQPLANAAWARGYQAGLDDCQGDLQDYQDLLMSIYLHFPKVEAWLTAGDG